MVAISATRSLNMTVFQGVVIRSCRSVMSIGFGDTALKCTIAAVMV